MEYINKIDLARQTKLLSGNTADYSGSILLGENFKVEGEVTFTGLKSYTGNTFTILVIDNIGKIYETNISILNEPDFASNSATSLATQQSIKAYIDNTISNLGSFEGGFNANSTVLPSTPQTDKGDYWYVTISGLVLGKYLNVGDLMIANKAGASNIDLNEWVFIDSNRDQATYDVYGLVKLATNQETLVGTIDNKAVTPLGLNTVLVTERIENYKKFLTYVDLELPTSVFQITTSAVPSASTITGTFITQVQNKVFASPISGTSVPTFRSLTSNDLPDLDFNKILTTSLPTTLSGHGITNVYTKVQTDSNYLQNQYGQIQPGDFKISGNGSLTNLFVQSNLILNNIISGVSETSKILAINPATKQVVFVDIVTSTVAPHTHPFSAITQTPVTIGGYGITDAVSTARTITINGITQDLSQNRNWAISGGTGGSSTGTTEEISFTGATGKVNIDFTLNNRQSNFGTNPLLMLYALTGTTKVFYPLGSSYNLSTNILTVDGVHDDKTIVLVGRGGGTTVTSSGSTVNVENSTESIRGIIELATIAEALARVDDERAMTALKTISLILDEKKKVNYQINPVGVNEVSILMENVGQVNTTLISGASSVKLKIGLNGTYPVGTQTYPFAYTANSRVFITYSYDDLSQASCNIKLKCQDN